MLARDLQSIVLYDQEGKFVGVRRPSSKLPIDINGIKIEIVDAIGSTGLELKVTICKRLVDLTSMCQLDSFSVVWSHGKLLFFVFLQTDPGVPIVYAGFGALMLTTCVSYLSHSQVNMHLFKE